MPRFSIVWAGCCSGRVTATEALPYLTAAYADDRGGDIAAHLGEVMWSLGRRGDAERIWSEASEADSDNHLLKSTRVRLHASK